jgi:mannosyl-oligosaccharide alpha-1,2-mannosidase
VSVQSRNSSSTSLIFVIGYDLLSGPFEHLAFNDTLVDALLAQSKSLANSLSFAFNTTTGVPDNTLDFSTRTRAGGNTNGLATIGTLVLEWTRLADLTGNKTYAELAQKGESYLLRPRPASSEPFPGLVGTNVDLTTGEFLDASGGWTGGTDSFYEYLIKMWVYDNTRFAEYRDRWIAAADSSIKYIAQHPSSRPDLTFLAQWQGTELEPYSEHRKSMEYVHFKKRPADQISSGLFCRR